MPTRPKRPARAKRRLVVASDDFVRISQAKIGSLQHYIIRVGTAILGGDMTGNVRGQNAIDIQTDRQGGVDGVTEVASGDYAVQLGALNTVSADYGVRIGYAGLVEGENGVGIGNNASVSGENGVAIGLNSNADGDNSTAIGGADIRTIGALGIGATARLLNAEYVFNTGVAPVIKRAAGLGAAANWPKHLAGAYAVFTSGLIDLKTATFHTLALPDGVHFIPLAMGLLLLELDSMTVQPTIEFGVTFDDDRYVAPRQTTNLTAVGKREHYLPESLANYETDPNFTITVGATATTMRARAYWVGVLLEDE